MYSAGPVHAAKANETSFDIIIKWLAEDSTNALVRSTKVTVPETVNVRRRCRRRAMAGKGGKLRQRHITQRCARWPETDRNTLLFFTGLESFFTLLSLTLNRTPSQSSQF